MIAPPLNVNEALDRLDELAGLDICIQGVLSFEFENVSLSHTPVAERRAGYHSSIWLEVGVSATRMIEVRGFAVDQDK